MSVFIVLLGFAGLAGTVWKLLKSSGSLIERLVDASQILSAVALAVMLLARIVQLSNVNWIEAKIAPAIAMFKGYALYQNPQTGVLTAWMYGPIGALFLSPAALAGHPTTARIIGSSITAFCSIAPAVCLLWMTAVGRSTRAISIGAFLVFGWMLVYAEDLGRCVTMPGADAPAIALAICACAFIWRRCTTITLCLSAICAILSIWTKQTFAPIVLGLLFYVFISSGPKIAARYAVILTLIGLAISAILCVFFGASNMWYQMVTIPMHHPLTNADAGLFDVLGKGIVDLLLTCQISLALLGIVLLLDASVRAPAANILDWLRTRRFSLLLVMAVCILPGSLWGYLKVSGYLNNLGCIDHLILLAALVGAAETCAHAKTTHVAIMDSLVGRGLSVFALILAMSTTLGTPNGLKSVWPALTHPYNNAEERTFEYVKAHPGEVYCPWNPLITLLAEGRLYHFEWGLIDRYNAKMPPGEKQYGAYLPQKMNMIVFLSEPISMATLTTIPSFNKRIQIPELPDCVVYVQQVK